MLVCIHHCACFALPLSLTHPAIVPPRSKVDAVVEEVGALQRTLRRYEGRAAQRAVEVSEREELFARAAQGQLAKNKMDIEGQVCVGGDAKFLCLCLCLCLRTASSNTTNQAISTDTRQAGRAVKRPPSDQEFIDSQPKKQTSPLLKKKGEPVNQHSKKDDTARTDRAIIIASE